MVATLRAVQLLAAAVLAGVPAFGALIWQPSLTSLAPDGDREALAEAQARWGRLLATAAGAALALAALADLLRIAASLRPVPFLSGPHLQTALALATGSRLGRLYALRAILALAVLACRPWRPGRRGPTAAALALSLLLLATLSLSGHAAATPGNPVWPVAADLLHLAATAAWYGGLLCFALLPWRTLERGEAGTVVPQVFHRFSNLGLAAMAVLVGTGLYMAALRLYGLLALVEHPYGQALLVKLSFLAGVLALAGVNRFWLRPRLARQPSGPGPGTFRAIRWLVTAEAALGLCVVAAAGVLASAAPPQGEPVRLSVTLVDHRFDPATLEVPANRPVRLTLTNRGSTIHSFVVLQMPHEMLSGGHQHGESDPMVVFVQPGQSTTVTFVALRPGEYLIYCMIGYHREQGMVGTLIVR
ncbi:MAG: CopD family protein [Bacillota bacterium]|nr:MAG: hypothetical protein DIU70_04815 [Bacillota bacterium]